MHPEPGSQTLTFLFTDVEGSTRLWEQYPQSMKDALKHHDAILRSAVTRASLPASAWLLVPMFRVRFKRTAPGAGLVSVHLYPWKEAR